MRKWVFRHWSGMVSGKLLWDFAIAYEVFGSELLYGSSVAAAFGELRGLEAGSSITRSLKITSRSPFTSMEIVFL